MMYSHIYLTNWIFKKMIDRKSYPKRYSFTSSGTMDFVSRLEKSEETFMLLQIASISAIIPNEVLFVGSFLKTFNHSCNIWKSGSSKHVVIASLICSLLWPTMIIESSAWSVSLTELDLISILWHALWRHKSSLFKMEKKKEKIVK